MIVVTTLYSLSYMLKVPIRKRLVCKKYIQELLNLWKRVQSCNIIENKETPFGSPQSVFWKILIWRYAPVCACKVWHVQLILESTIHHPSQRITGNISMKRSGKYFNKEVFHSVTCIFRKLGWNWTPLFPQDTISESLFTCPFKLAFF